MSLPRHEVVREMQAALTKYGRVAQCNAIKVIGKNHIKSKCHATRNSEVIFTFYCILLKNINADHRSFRNELYKNMCERFYK